MKKTILFLEWASFGTPFIVEAFEQLGYKVEKIPFPRDKVDTRRDEEYTGKLVQQILKKQYAAVFSYNYFPVVAVACKACRLPYISWTYDSPFIQLYSKTLEYDTNFVFVFDSYTVEELRQLGYDRVFYLPMAAPKDYYTRMQQNNSYKKQYACDVAFVGSLYSEDFHNPFRALNKLEGYYAGVVDGIVQAQKVVYGVNFLEQALYSRPDLVEELRKHCPIGVAADGLETIEWTYANYYLSRKITSIERRALLEALGAVCDTKLYTPEKNELKGVDVRGKVDFYREAPYVYSSSKINLNISLRSIKHGVPLRAFDIMGNGGFLLSNYQEDFFDLFEPDEEVVLYGSQEEAVEKARFYLEHDALRKEIAQRGYERIQAEHTYLHRAEVMCSCIEEYWM